jgi:hypothetical protein
VPGAQVSGEALGLGVLLGVAELDGVTLGVGELDCVTLGVGVGEQGASAVAPPRHDEGQPQAEQDGAPPVEKDPAGQGAHAEAPALEKAPAGQGMAFTVERGQ